MSNPAGSFEGTPTTMTPTGSIVVKFVNPDLAGQTVTITARNEDNEEVTFDVGPLDPLGCGEVSWGLPDGWGSTATVELMHDTAQMHNVSVIPE